MKNKTLTPLLTLLSITITTLTTSVSAATRFWDGGGTNRFWDAAANWSNNVAPVNGDVLVFPGNAAQFASTNRAAGGLTNLASLQLTGAGYNIFGLPLNLTNGITQSVPLGGANTFGATLQLRRSQNWFVAGRNVLTLRS